MYLFDTSYTNILPRQTGDFFTQWEDCLKQLRAVTADKRYIIFGINIFIHSDHESDFLIKRGFLKAALESTFGDKCPTYGLLPISPEEDLNVVIEAAMVSSQGIVADFKKHNEIIYSILTKNNYKEVWANGIEDLSETNGTKKSAEKSFSMMHGILLSENMSFDNVIRQWNYIGSILNMSTEGPASSQNYQVFNKVRRDFYTSYRVVKGYPAATGVGMNYNSVIIGFYACSQSNGMKTFTIRNPVQVNPYNYQNVLSLTESTGSEENHPPLFERAILLSDNNKWMLYVSGTASIIGQETAGKGDLHVQTLITINNIEKLVSKDNLKSHLGEAIFTNSLEYTRFRVYVKNRADIPLVRSICESKFGDTPSLYVNSDICRHDLLVEIEADLASE